MRKRHVFMDLAVSQPHYGQKFHGGGEYTKTIFKELCDNYLDKIELTVFLFPDRFIDTWIMDEIKQNNIKFYYIQNYVEIEQIPEFKNADVYFAGLMDDFTSIKFNPQTVVIGVYHGFRDLEMPADKYSYLYENTLKDSLKRTFSYLLRKELFKKRYKDQEAQIRVCDYIIGVSIHSGYAARVFFPQYDERKIKVYYSPQKFIENSGQIQKKYNENIILMLGGHRWIKNVYRGAIALDGLFSEGKLSNYKVHVVSGIPPKIMKRLHNKDKFVEFDYLSPEDLESEYLSCDLFFYPTLNEGFGYPPLEVMRYNKTCVISAVNSLPEIYKDAVYYCNPTDIKEMQGRLLQASENKIDEDLIATVRENIYQKQNSDLNALCDLICRGEKLSALQQK